MPILLPPVVTDSMLFANYVLQRNASRQNNVNLYNIFEKKAAETFAWIEKVRTFASIKKGN